MINASLVNRKSELFNIVDEISKNIDQIYIYAHDAEMKRWELIIAYTLLGRCWLDQYYYESNIANIYYALEIFKMVLDSENSEDIEIFSGVTAIEDFEYDLFLDYILFSSYNEALIISLAESGDLIEYGVDSYIEAIETLIYDSPYSERWYNSLPRYYKYIIDICISYSIKTNETKYYDKLYEYISKYKSIKNDYENSEIINVENMFKAFNQSTLVVIDKLENTLSTINYANNFDQYFETVNNLMFLYTDLALYYESVDYCQKATHYLNEVSYGVSLMREYDESEKLNKILEILNILIEYWSNTNSDSPIK